MASFSRSLFSRPETGLADGPAVALDDVFGEVPDMEPAWAEGSSIFHTRARCSRYLAIDAKNRRSQKSEPSGKTLCEICREIVLRGRKG